MDDGFPRTWSGYARHYGVNLIGNVSGKFFGNFALPLLFQQDEQFQRRGSPDSVLNRLSHVLVHAIWAGQGRVPVNVSSLGGNALNAILANTYQPQSQRTAGATARQRFPVWACHLLRRQMPILSSRRNSGIHFANSDR